MLCLSSSWITHRHQADGLKYSPRSTRQYSEPVFPFPQVPLLTHFGSDNPHQPPISLATHLFRSGTNVPCWAAPLWGRPLYPAVRGGGGGVLTSHAGSSPTQVLPLPLLWCSYALLWASVAPQLQEWMPACLASTQTQEAELFRNKTGRADDFLC